MRQARPSRRPEASARFGENTRRPGRIGSAAPLSYASGSRLPRRTACCTSQTTFDAVELDLAAPYAAEDADITWRLYTVLQEQLEQRSLVDLFELLEMPLVPVLADMERNGIRVDQDFLGDLSQQMEKQLDEIKEKIRQFPQYPGVAASRQAFNDWLALYVPATGAAPHAAGAAAADK